MMGMGTAALSVQRCSCIPPSSSPDSWDPVPRGDKALPGLGRSVGLCLGDIMTVPANPD